LVYDFQVCSDSQMTSLVASGTDVLQGEGITYWQAASDLLEERWYWWRARSSDGVCYSDWSGERKFYLSIGEIVYGDLNKDGKTNVSDVLYLINYLFKGGPSPGPIKSGDVNADCKVNVTDAIYLINYLFKSGAAPKSGCST
ncbi:MAG: dockerin type I domain-containing protein, partial [candidate division Zixibacteria bacterium]|nr:dockerin type I domain-containing protein [candidate division Zixibacteria bacterium]